MLPLPRAGVLLDDRFQLSSQIGSGVCCLVWSARDRDLGIEVAVKMVTPHAVGKGSENEWRACMKREAETLARISSAHVPRVYAVGHHETLLFFAQELIRGETLVERRRYPVAEVARVVVDICAALEAVHRAGYVHLDVKPANIIRRDSDASSVLVDFGLAKRMDSRIKAPVGTPRYMAPEMITQSLCTVPNERVKATSLADLYSLGSTAFMLAAGRAPFDSEGASSVMADKVTRDPPLLSSLLPRAPTKFVAAVHRALARRPSDRYSSASEMRDAFAVRG